MEVQVGAVAVSAPLGGESGVASVHGALVHELEVNLLIVRLDGEVIGELLAALHATEGILLVQRDHDVCSGGVAPGSGSFSAFIALIDVVTGRAVPVLPSVASVSAVVDVRVLGVRAALAVVVI